jgi:hypothetical protein
MAGNFYCLVVQGSLTSDDIRDELLLTAYRMIVSHRKRHRLKTKECEGLVQTKFQRQSLVDVSGTLFTAELEMEKGKILVTYNLRDQYLRELEEMELGAWVGIDELGTEIDKDRFRPSPIKRLKKHFINN